MGVAAAAAVESMKAVEVTEVGSVRPRRYIMSCIISGVCMFCFLSLISARYVEW